MIYLGNGLGSLKTKNNLSINCGNSGTLSRLILSILSTYPHKIKITGDKSLNKRPMRRIIASLEKFGCGFKPKNKNHFEDNAQLMLFREVIAFDRAKNRMIILG